MFTAILGASSEYNKKKTNARLISADLQAENWTRHLPAQINRLATTIISRPVRSKTGEIAAMK